MKSKIDDNKTVREEAQKELLTALLKLDFKDFSPVYKTMLVEVLINGKTFTELKETVKLTTSRQKAVFQDAVNILKRNLQNVSNTLTSYQAMEKELSRSKAVIEFLEDKTNKENGIPPKLKKKLDIPIGKAGFSARVQQICSSGGIHSVSDLVGFSRREFLQLRNCGKISADEVEIYLEKNGLFWKMR